MSTLWTPEGEYQPKVEFNAGEANTSASDEDLAGDLLAEDQQLEAELLAREIREADPATIVANHCYGLFELAAIHLSAQPPQLAHAALAIDALAGVVEKVGERLGAYATELSDGLAQLRLAFIQLSTLSGPTPESTPKDA